jgi:hypothetical protein
MFYKKLTFSIFVLLLAGNITQSNCMFQKDSLKKTGSLFAHDHPIATSLFFNTLFFSCTGLLKSKPFKRLGLFISTSAIGAYFSQHLGHNYLHSKYIPHNPKVHFPICSTLCNSLAKKGINQYVAERFEEYQNNK